MSDAIYPADVSAAAEQLAALVAGLDPGDVPLSWAAGMFAAFDRIERLASAAKTLLATRVEESEVWRREGFRRPAHYIAAVSGSSVAHAHSQVTTSKRLADLPVTAAAVRSGGLSFAQADNIADAATVSPDAEPKLLAMAAEGASLAELRDECGRAKAAGDPDPEKTYQRLRRERHLRQHRDTDGAWRMTSRGTVDDQAELNAALDDIIDELFQAARDRDEQPTREQLAYDALIELARRSHRFEDDAPPTDVKERRRGRASTYLGIVRVDLEALRRGRPHEDELCEIAGLGPIPVARARELLGDSVLKLVITKGVAVQTVVHLGRSPTVAQRTAMAWAMPCCTVNGCNSTWIQYDHREDWARTRHTTLPELDPLCHHHHQLKTLRGWALVPGAGKRVMVPPDDPRHPSAHRPDTSGPPGGGQPAAAPALIDNFIEAPAA